MSKRAMTTPAEQGEAVDWIWYDHATKLLTFGRWPKDGRQRKYVLAPVLSENMPSPEAMAMAMCPQCGVNRMREPCPRGSAAAAMGACPMIGTAQVSSQKMPAPRIEALTAARDAAMAKHENALCELVAVKSQLAKLPQAGPTVWLWERQSNIGDWMREWAFDKPEPDPAIRRMTACVQVPSRLILEPSVTIKAGEKCPRCGESELITVHDHDPCNRSCLVPGSTCDCTSSPRFLWCDHCDWKREAVPSQSMPEPAETEEIDWYNNPPMNRCKCGKAPQLHTYFRPDSAEVNMIRCGACEAHSDEQFSPEGAVTQWNAANPVPEQIKTKPGD